MQEEHPEVDLGSYPYRQDGYGANPVMRGPDESQLDLVLEEVRQMILDIGAEPFQHY